MVCASLMPSKKKRKKRDAAELPRCPSALSFFFAPLQPLLPCKMSYVAPYLDNVDYKSYVIGFSCAVYAFEQYLK